MHVQLLESKDYNRVSYYEISTRLKEQNSTSIRLNLDELKSIISLIFSSQFHSLEDREKWDELNDFIASEKSEIMNTTRDFGRQMLENLDGFKKDWLESFAEKKYDPNYVFNHPEIHEFISVAMLDYMPIRSFEYGELFIKNFSKVIIDGRELNFYGTKIQNALKKEVDPMEKIAQQIMKADDYNFPLSEQFLIGLSLKERLTNSKGNKMEYGLVTNVAREKMHKLIINQNVYKKILNKSFTLRWNNNRGMGGPKL